MACSFSPLRTVPSHPLSCCHCSLYRFLIDECFLRMLINIKLSPSSLIGRHFRRVGSRWPGTIANALWDGSGPLGGNQSGRCQEVCNRLFTSLAPNCHPHPPRSGSRTDRTLQRPLPKTHPARQIALGSERCSAPRPRPPVSPACLTARAPPNANVSGFPPCLLLSLVISNERERCADEILGAVEVVV